MKIGSICRRRIVTVDSASSLVEAALMREHHVGRAHGDDVSFDDLMSAYASDIEGLAQVIRSGIEREVIESTAVPAARQGLRIPASGTAGWGRAMA